MEMTPVGKERERREIIISKEDVQQLFPPPPLRQANKECGAISEKNLERKKHDKSSSYLLRMAVIVILGEKMGRLRLEFDGEIR